MSSEFDAVDPEFVTNLEDLDSAHEKVLGGDKESHIVQSPVLFYGYSIYTDKSVLSLAMDHCEHGPGSQTAGIDAFLSLVYSHLRTGNPIPNSMVVIPLCRGLDDAAGLSKKMVPIGLLLKFGDAVLRLAVASMYHQVIEAYEGPKVAAEFAAISSLEARQRDFVAYLRLLNARGGDIFEHASIQDILPLVTGEDNGDVVEPINGDTGVQEVSTEPEDQANTGSGKQESGPDDSGDGTGEG